MPDSSISGLTVATVLAAPDEFVIVDKNDTTQASSGTTKRLTLAVLMADPVFLAGIKAALDSRYTPFPQPTVLLVGDSITALCGSPSFLDTGDAYSARGFFNWANWLMGERYEVAATAIRGVGGETATGLAARIATELANHPSDWVVVETGANSVIQGHTFATITADLTAILNAIAAAGRRCCLLTVWGANEYTTLAMQQLAAKVSQWIATLPSTRRGLVVADAYTVLTDPTTGKLGAGMTFDTLHPGTAAAYRVGVQVANAMRPFAPPRPAPLHADTDALVAMGNQAAVGGPNWTLEAGSAVAYTRDPDTFGYVASATVDATGAQWSYRESLGLDHGGANRIVAGDVVQIRARIRWSGLTWSSNPTSLSPFLQVSWRAAFGSGSFNTAGTNATVGNEPSFALTTFTADDVAASGDVFITSTKVTVPALADDATAIDSGYFRVALRSSGLSGGKVTVSEFAAYKVAP